MHPEDIKAAIRKKSSSQAAISRKLGVSGMAVNHVVTGRQKSERIARLICEITGLPASQLWPGKYPGLELLQSAQASDRARRASTSTKTAGRRPA